MSDPSRLPIVWTIAGSDSSGGAGIQADLAAFRGFGVYGCSVITALTAQNSFAVGHIAETSHKSVAAQINALDADLPASAIKLGMLANADTVAAVAKYLRDYPGPVVCDPVVKASSGQSLLTGAAGALLREQLLPRVDVLTPNRDEAEALIGRRIEGLGGVEQAAARIVAMGARSVLITGGHFDAQGERRMDFWTDGRDKLWLAGPNIDSIHSHGSGCTLSAAIAAAMALGYAAVDAIVLAKAYITRGFRQARQLGGGPGPVAHGGWPEALEDFPVILGSWDESPATSFPDCGGPLGLYPVVDSVDWVRRLLARGVTTLQLRIKGEPTAEIAAQIRDAVTLATKHGARLFINDHWRLALECGAYGVHLGQSDLDTADLPALHAAGLRLGISTHSYREIARAHALQPSYIALGPIYETTSKAMPFGPQGLEQLQRWVRLLGERYTLTAIGGIDRERAPAVLATGVGSCAMISAITQAEDPEQVVEELLSLHGAPTSTSG